MTQWTLLALLGLVLFASNSTMRPINMCPEKFLPSCGTWRTIVTDRKVFAQVRIFSAHFFLVPALSRPPPQTAAGCRRRSRSFFHKEPGRKSSSKNQECIGTADRPTHSSLIIVPALYRQHNTLFNLTENIHLILKYIL